MIVTDTPCALLPEWVVDARKAGLSHGAVRLYAVLMLHARGGGAAWPGKLALAPRLGTSVAEVEELLAELELVRALRVEGGGRLRRSRRYRLVVATPSWLAIGESAGEQAA